MCIVTVNLPSLPMRKTVDCSICDFHDVTHIYELFIPTSDLYTFLRDGHFSTAQV